MIDYVFIMNQGEEHGYLEKNNVGIGQIPESNQPLNFFCVRREAWFYNPIAMSKHLSLSVMVLIVSFARWEFVFRNFLMSLFVVISMADLC